MHGELNKLAANIAIGRNIAGVKDRRWRLWYDARTESCYCISKTIRRQIELVVALLLLDLMEFVVTV